MQTPSVHLYPGCLRSLSPAIRGRKVSGFHTYHHTVGTVHVCGILNRISLPALVSCAFRSRALSQPCLPIDILPPFPPSPLPPPLPVDTVHPSRVIPAIRPV